MNGNTIYVTSNFKEFNVEDNANTTWDQQSAMDSTAVCSSLPVIECYGFVPIAFVKLTSAVTQNFLASVDTEQGHPTFK